MFNIIQRPNKSKIAYKKMNSDVIYLIPQIDSEYQFIDSNGLTRIVVLLAGSIGDKFVIKNDTTYSSIYRLTISNLNRSNTIDWIYSGSIKSYIFDGKSWCAESNGSGTDDKFSLTNFANISLGRYSRGDNQGVGIGYSANGNGGVAVGNSAQGTNYGAAVGTGANSNNKYNSFAKSTNSKCERYGEESKSADGIGTSKYMYSQLDWFKETTDAIPTEIFLSGVASNRALVLANSAYMFDINIVAYSNATTEGAVWNIKGGIRRDGSNNTTLIGTPVKTLISNDTGVTTWDVSVTADDTNEALKITVTGEAGHSIRWNAEGRISECRF